MVFASSVLLFAGSLQTLPALAGANDSLFLAINVLPAYGRQFKCDLKQSLIKLSSSYKIYLWELGRSEFSSGRRDAYI
jgi:hypothetical protein